MKTLLRPFVYLKNEWPSLILLFGLGLVIDNWNQNHGLLVLPGWVLFMLGLEWLIDARVKAELSHE